MIFGWIGNSRQSEVADLQVTIGIQEKIAWFEISM